MASRDLHHKIKVLPSIVPAAVKTANAVTTGATIDSAGLESVEHVMQTGVITDGTFTPAVFAGDESNMSDEAAVTSADELIGTIADATFAATDGSKTKKIGYRGPKRYSRLKVTQASATTGGYISAVAILGDARSQPQ